MKFILLSFFLIFLLSGCSSNETSSNGSYSSSTLDAFERIESANYLPVKKQIPIESKNKIANSTTPPESTTVIVKSSVGSKDENLIELNQNLAIYCMKKSRAKKFKSEKQCQKYVKEVLSTCETSNKHKNRTLVSCVKKKLALK